MTRYHKGMPSLSEICLLPISLSSPTDGAVRAVRARPPDEPRLIRPSPLEAAVCVSYLPPSQTPQQSQTIGKQGHSRENDQTGLLTMRHLHISTLTPMDYNAHTRSRARVYSVAATQDNGVCTLKDKGRYRCHLLQPDSSSHPLVLAGDCCSPIGF